MSQTPPAVPQIFRTEIFENGGNRYQGQKFYKISELWMEGYALSGALSVLDAPIGKGTRTPLPFFPWVSFLLA